MARLNCLLSDLGTFFAFLLNNNCKARVYSHLQTFSSAHHHQIITNQSVKQGNASNTQHVKRLSSESKRGQSRATGTHEVPLIRNHTRSQQSLLSLTLVKKRGWFSLETTSTLRCSVYVYSSTVHEVMMLTNCWSRSIKMGNMHEIHASRQEEGSPFTLLSWYQSTHDWRRSLRDSFCSLLVSHLLLSQNRICCCLSMLWWWRDISRETDKKKGRNWSRNGKCILPFSTCSLANFLLVSNNKKNNH